MHNTEIERSQILNQFLVDWLYMPSLSITGVKGLIYGQSSKVSDVFDIVGGAVIQVMGREGIQFRSTALGEYYKLLLPGTYTLLVSWAGRNDSYWHNQRFSRLVLP